MDSIFFKRGRYYEYWSDVFLCSGKCGIAFWEISISFMSKPINQSSLIPETHKTQTLKSLSNWILFLMETVLSAVFPEELGG